MDPPTNAKDELRTKARELRGEGMDYEEIAARLGIAKSSVSLWVRDMPRPPRLSYEECRKRSADGARRYWEGERQIREARRAAIQAAAAAEVGDLTDREVFLVGAMAYWCEGAKSKPYRVAEEVNFINSDPAIILFFLGFLDRAGVARDRLRYRVHVHETADVGVVTRCWAELVKAETGQFIRPNIKRHNPLTRRKNAGADYRGCLQIRVTKSRELYRKIAGWAEGIVAASVGS